MSLGPAEIEHRFGFHKATIEGDRWEYFARVLWSVIDMGERMKRCTRCGKEKRA